MRTNYRLSTWVFATICGLLALGCGGTGTVAGGTVNTTFGVFQAAYNRSTAGTVVVFVPEIGQATATVRDASAGVFSGNVTITNETISGTLSNGTLTLMIGGTLSGTGTGSSIAGGTLTGDFSANFAAVFIGDGSQNVFAGNYSGTFAGGDSGTWTVTVGTDGSVSGSATDNVNNFNVSGTVSESGGGNLSLASGTASGATWSGGFYPNGSLNACSGTWTSGTETGTWTGSQK